MGKNKKGGLIEDRVIRNPMEQMRRKQKFKDKEKRKEQRFAAREARGEFNHNQQAHDPMLGYEQGYIQQLKGHGTHNQDQPKSDGQPPKVDTQQESLQQWEQVQQNYKNMLEGKPVQFRNTRESDAHHPEVRQPQPSTLERKPIIYKSQEQQSKGKPPPPREAPRQILHPQESSRQQNRPPQKRVLEEFVDDPLDPRYKPRLLHTPSFQGNDISPALQEAIQEEHEKSVTPQEVQKAPPKPQSRFVPAALRRVSPNVAQTQDATKQQVVEESKGTPPIKPEKQGPDTKFNAAFASIFPAYSSSGSDEESDADQEVTPHFQQKPKIVATTQVWGDKKSENKLEQDVLDFLNEIGE